ncbi:MAG: PAS domain S-box protein [Syntrophaceae bacterium]|nr:PAS domain S-box protein [Syntrophaceae bacterium]
MKGKLLRVLIIEDSKDYTLLLIRELKKGGYHPLYEQAATATAIKKALKEKEWDIILFDDNTPNVTIPAAMALLKKANINIPTIIISEKIDKNVIVECKYSGLRNYILKSHLTRLCPAIIKELKKLDVRNNQNNMEKKLRREEKRFRTLADQSSDVIVFLNREGTITYENRATEKALGFPAKKKVGRKMLERIHPDDLKFVSAEFNRLLSDNKVRASQAEIRIRHKDGNWRNFEAIASNLVIDNVIEAVIVNLRDITERKRMEKEIQESEEKYRSLFDNSIDAVFLTAPDGEILAANPEACRLFGRTGEELCREGRDNLLDQTDPRLVAGMKERKRTGRFRGELTFLRKDGTKFPGEISSSVFKDRHGQLRTSIIIRDITDRKKTENMLLFIKKAVESTSDAIGMSNAQRDDFYHNKALIELFEYTPDELKAAGGGNALFVNKDIAREVFNTILNGKSWSGEVEMVSKSGRKFSVLLRADAIKDEKGKVIGLIGVHTDITDHKKAEKALQASEQKYRFLTERMNDILWIMDMNLRTTYVTPSIKNVLGFSPEERLEQSVNEQLTPDSLSRVLETMDKELALEKDDQSDPERSITLTLNFYHKDGSTRWLETIVNGIRDDRGILTGLYGVSRDVTQRKHVEEELKRFAENLEDTNRALRVLMTQRDKDQKELEEELQSNINDLVIPYLKKLSKGNLDARNKRYVNVLEKNLEEILSPFMKNFRSLHRNLTPKEIQIVDLIKQGKDTKEIADMLNASISTITTHRNNIRKKLNLLNSKINLRSHLLSFE